MSPEMTGSVLIVDDDAAMREALTDIFDSIATTVYTAANGQEGLEILERERQHIIVQSELTNRVSPVTIS
jgi:CheY-like chemotaxis protein